MTVAAVLFNDDSHLLQHGGDQDRIAWEASALEAQAVADSLRRSGFDVANVPARSSLTDLVGELVKIRPDFVFNICESFAADSKMEAAVAGLLDLFRVPYTGNSSLTLALARDKVLTKELLRSRGLTVTPWAVLTSPDEALPMELTPPLFVKTRFEDGSHGISERSVCPTADRAREVAADLFREWRQDCLVEEFLPGREFNIGVIFDGEALPLAEIDYQLAPGLPRVVTFEAKWLPGSAYDCGTPVKCPAENVGEPLALRLREVARLAYIALGCRDYARVDMRLDFAGNPCVIEVNPNPAISPDAGLARAAVCAGITYDRLIEGIARAALSRSVGGGRWE